MKLQDKNLKPGNKYDSTILAAGWKSFISFKIVAPSLVIVTSPFPDWIYFQNKKNSNQIIEKYFTKIIYHFVHSSRTQTGPNGIGNS